MTSWKRRFQRKKDAPPQTAQLKPTLGESEAKTGNDPPKSFHVTPQNRPEPINHHLVSQDGGKTWRKEPGVLSIVMCGKKVEDTAPEIESLFLPLDNTGPDNQRLKTRIIDCRHKLYAVRYHLGAIRGEITRCLEDFKKDYHANSGVAFEFENPRLIYETEAFLLQVKSSLDILTQMLGCTIGPLRSCPTFGTKMVMGQKHVGGRVIDALTKNGFEKLGQLFEDHRRQWIQELVDMRDEITHSSRLEGFKCFVEEPYRGQSEVQIHYPTMPCGSRVDSYCDAAYAHLLQLYQSAIGLTDFSSQK